MQKHDESAYRHHSLRTGAFLLATLLAWTIAARADNAESTDQYAKATFAGGCFWCMEPPFDKLEGVISTTSGYSGGTQENPTYRQVTSGNTGHAEVVQVVYDPSKINYQELLKVFWRNIDPLVKNRQFCDEGSQYRTAIYYHDEEQQRLAQMSKEDLERGQRFSEPIVTEIEPLKQFYPAETYHQDYYLKNPLRYKYYRFACGRDRRLNELWDEGKG